jgi:outer membrane protein TolC
VAASAVSQASEALRIVQDRHGEGLTTISEVLNAQTALLRAKMNLLAARYDYYLGFAHARLASGKLEDVTPFIS